MTIRQDHCKIFDHISSSNTLSIQCYFTGSKAEGLILAGSDEDYMHDINTCHDIEVSECMQELFQSARKNKFLLDIDNVYPGFVLLKCLSSMGHSSLHHSLHVIRHDLYLSSRMFVSHLLRQDKDGGFVKIQGPSLESWSEYGDIDEPGTDMVPSIRCKFWPSPAMKWIGRPRHYGWPSLRDRENIVSFGFHLVPVGHPLSPMNAAQWRISFSIAERTMVWSFNHLQIQCYAILKTILKEFIKVKSSENTKGVLCSYFIKTFLFWQYEETDTAFWQSENLRGCVLYLLRELCGCVKDGVLKHYFIPQFNLFKVKLTRSAQRELLHLLDVIIQYDMAIMAQCQSLAGV